MRLHILMLTAVGLPPALLLVRCTTAACDGAAASDGCGPPVVPTEVQLQP